MTRGDSVIVSAATGTGKTLIAEQAIEFYTELGHRSVYTSPIKALSNQKYKDFVEMFGRDRVGILTGDIAINPRGQILVMTTEVYRNMALTDPESLVDIGLLILDEVHFMNDPERGTVWEESIIFSPPNVRFLALSATIPNANEFADWIEDIHGHDVYVIENMERAVPLYHHFFLGGDVLVKREKLAEQAGLVENMNYHTRGRRGRRGGKNKGKRPVAKNIGHLDLLKLIDGRGGLPCLFFSFSRKKCENQALETAHNMQFYDYPPKEIDKIIAAHLMEPDIADMESIRSIARCLRKGVAFHHAGMLPAAKRAVEEAFEKNLIKVLYATETFAVGINYPARSVAFESLKKYDGTHHRYVNSKEYFQMAGRAGRRGMDDSGDVYCTVDRYNDDLMEIARFTKEDKIPIYSQFHLSYNTVINMIEKNSKKEIGQILEKSFESFRKKRSGKRVNVWTSWYNRVRTLEKLGYVRNGQLTTKGRFMKHIFTEELVTGELFADDKWKDWSVMDITCMAAAITYEDRHSRRGKRPDRGPRFYKLMSSIQGNGYLGRNLSRKGLATRIPIVEKWFGGANFKTIVDEFELAEGDLIRIFRQTIDVLEQIKRAARDEGGREDLIDKIDRAIQMMDREVVAVSFD